MTTVTKGKNVPTTPKNGRAPGERDPVFDELGFPKDPDNLYLQTVEVMLPTLEIQEKGMKFSIIGYGNVGSWTARILAKHGAKLVAVMDQLWQAARAA